MSGVNKVTLIGRLGKDPDVRFLENNIALARFPLATSEYYLDKQGQKQERTEWHNIAVWRKLAESAQKVLTKGKLVYIEGKLSTRSYQDAGGQMRYVTEVIATNFILLDRRDLYKNNESQTAPQSSSEVEKDDNIDIPAEEFGDDLPF